MPLLSRPTHAAARSIALAMPVLALTLATGACPGHRAAAPRPSAGAARAPARMPNTPAQDTPAPPAAPLAAAWHTQARAQQDARTAHVYTCAAGDVPCVPLPRVPGEGQRLAAVLQHVAAGAASPADARLARALSATWLGKAAARAQGPQLARLARLGFEERDASFLLADLPLLLHQASPAQAARLLNAAAPALAERVALTVVSHTALEAQAAEALLPSHATLLAARTGLSLPMLHALCEAVLAGSDAVVPRLPLSAWPAFLTTAPAAAPDALAGLFSVPAAATQTTALHVPVTAWPTADSPARLLVPKPGRGSKGPSDAGAAATLGVTVARLWPDGQPIDPLARALPAALARTWRHAAPTRVMAVRHAAVVLQLLLSGELDDPTAWDAAAARWLHLDAPVKGLGALLHVRLSGVAADVLVGTLLAHAVDTGALRGGTHPAGLSAAIAQLAQDGPDAVRTTAGYADWPAAAQGWSARITPRR